MARLTYVHNHFLLIRFKIDLVRGPLGVLLDGAQKDRKVPGWHQ